VNRKKKKEKPPAAPEPKPAREKAPAAAPAKPKKKRAPKPEPEPEPPVPQPVAAPSEYTLPPLSLLQPLPPAKEREIKGDFQAGARILEETLSEFGIDAKVTNVETGPVVTSYEMLPPPGVKLSRITNLADNIALTMKAKSVRVQAPIPGKGVVGIEVPNPNSTMVFLREIIESNEWEGSSAALPLAVGKDVGGREIVADLSKMPHLLIAGATGSGKSVCMNSLLAGLLMSRTPDQLRLMLVDPKMVEFSFFNMLPHLVVPVITDPKKVSLGLRWAINEMEKRYKLFAKAGVRNIQTYNARPVATQTDMFEETLGAPSDEKKLPDRLPYIVIVIDELADLMMVAQAEVEGAIARLAQLSRAVGIHMIIATQRPSVNVITGTIKANFPARLAFQVAQKVDSRTILDANGADKLLGRGDMLFLPPGTSKLIRAQGTMTTDQEIRDIVDFWKEQAEPFYEVAIKEKIESKKVEVPEVDGDDDLLEAAIEIIRQTKRASTSSLQRRLRIGYNRAGRLMDQLEERGIVGPPKGSEPRDILIDLDGEIPSNEQEAGAAL
jgi:S-DNA-T family DNA segregation ATPase FtsK/SpoIIIE